MPKRKILLIGLDSMPDKEIFEKHKDELPNLRKMLDNGFFATLESCHPPITVPAWRVMMSSKTPGRLGVYGFRHRKGYSYTDGWFTTSSAFHEPMIWDILKEKGKKYLNYEQDLGKPNLRQAKTSFRPIGFLKKFICTYKA